MPSENEFREARRQERADGWGYVEGVPEADWPNVTSKDVTRLESGKVLHHHVKADCSGDCCLHGTSSHPSCRMPRTWRFDKGIIEHECPHGIGHPCYAGAAYVSSRGGIPDTIHGCDGCCVSVDNRPFDSTTLNSNLEIRFLTDAVNSLTERLTRVKEDQEAAERKMKSLTRHCDILSASIALLAVGFVLVAYFLSR